MLYSWNHKYVAFSDLIFALSNMDWSFLRAFSWNFPGGLAVKNMPANVGDAGSIPGLGRSPGEGNSPTHSSILAWEIPWTEAPGYRGYSPWGHKESDMTLQLSNNNNYNNAFSWPDSSFFFFLVLNHILFSGYTTVYPLTYWRTSWLLPSFVSCI